MGLLEACRTPCRWERACLAWGGVGLKQVVVWMLPGGRIAAADAQDVHLGLQYPPRVSLDSVTDLGLGADWSSVGQILLSEGLLLFARPTGRTRSELPWDLKPSLRGFPGCTALGRRPGGHLRSAPRSPWAWQPYPQASASVFTFSFSPGLSPHPGPGGLSSRLGRGWSCRNRDTGHRFPVWKSGEPSPLGKGKDR